MTFEALIPLYGGYMLSRGDEIVFLKGALPGEIVEAEIVEKKRDYSIASVKDVVESSPDRVSPACPVFNRCGGCHYQFISYKRQVSIKEEVVLDCLRRIGKVEAELLPPLVSEPWHYRKRVQFKVSSDGRIGFYRQSTHEVEEFEECLLLSDELNMVLKALKSGGLPSGIKEILLQSGDRITALIKGGGYDFRVAAAMLSAAGVSGIASINGEVDGERQIELHLGSFQYRVSTGTFFQSNWSLNNVLVSFIEEFLAAVKPSKVVDLYAGAGNLSIPFSPYAESIVSVEEDRQSFRDGQVNLKLNRIRNIKFVNRRVEEFDIQEGTDLVIMDPPRTGVSRRVLGRILDRRPEWVIYLSCNPSTFSRDIKHLNEEYRIESLRVVDMFPQTYHIELLGILRVR
jgi:23S rRNA (uracil1939-C5)-methyltransferase